MTTAKKGSQAPAKSHQRGRAGRKPNTSPNADAPPPVTAPSPQQPTPRNNQRPNLTDETTQSLTAILAAMPRNYRDSASPLSNLISQEQLFTCCKSWRRILPIALRSISDAYEVTNAQAIAVLGSMLCNRTFVLDMVNSNPETPDQPEQLANPHMQSGQPTDQQPPAPDA
jgi:hypothetical protein